MEHDEVQGLRMKLKTVGASSNIIQTVYGIGYRLNPQVEEEVEKVRKSLSKQ